MHRQRVDARVSKVARSVRSSAGECARAGHTRARSRRCANEFRPNLRRYNLFERTRPPRENYSRGIPIHGRPRLRAPPQEKVPLSARPRRDAPAPPERSIAQSARLLAIACPQERFVPKRYHSRSNSRCMAVEKNDRPVRNSGNRALRQAGRGRDKGMRIPRIPEAPPDGWGVPPCQKKLLRP